MGGEAGKVGKPPFPRRIRRVNRWARERRIFSVLCREPDSPFEAARDVSNHCPDRFCGPGGRLDNLACAARARADRQYLFRSAAASARRHSARQPAAAPPTTKRKCRSCRAAGCCRPRTGRRRAGRARHPAACSRSRWRRRPGTTVVPQNTQPGIAVAAAAAGRRRRSGRRQRAAWRPARCRRDSASPRRAAARRRPCSRATRSCPSRRRKDHQQEGELLGSRQDHRPHHQFRRGYRRDRAVRRAAGEDRRLLHAARRPKPPTPTPLSRSTRSRCRAR